MEICAYDTKLQEKSWYFLSMINKENITESLDKWNFESLHGAICNLHLCYNFAPMLHENTLVFSLSEACNFYMHIFKHCNNLVQVFYMPS